MVTRRNTIEGRCWKAQAEEEGNQMQAGGGGRAPGPASQGRLRGQDPGARRDEVQNFCHHSMCLTSGMRLTARLSSEKHTVIHCVVTTSGTCPTVSPSPLWLEGTTRQFWSVSSGRSKGPRQPQPLQRPLKRPGLSNSDVVTGEEGVTAKPPCRLTSGDVLHE